MSQKDVVEEVVVIEPFNDHQKGDRIPAEQAVGHEANVVKVKEGK